MKWWHKKEKMKKYQIISRKTTAAIAGSKPPSQCGGHLCFPSKQITASTLSRSMLETLSEHQILPVHTRIQIRKNQSPISENANFTSQNSNHNEIGDDLERIKVESVVCVVWVNGSWMNAWEWRDEPWESEKRHRLGERNGDDEEWLNSLGFYLHYMCVLASLSYWVSWIGRCCLYVWRGRGRGRGCCCFRVFAFTIHRQTIQHRQWLQAHCLTARLSL